MRKAFLLLIIIAAMTGTLWLNVSATDDASVETTVYSRQFTDAKVGEHVSAKLLTADGALQELPCSGTEEPGYILCRFPEEYAGQQLPIQLTRNNIMFVSVVDVPMK